MKRFFQEKKEFGDLKRLSQYVKMEYILYQLDHIKEMIDGLCNQMLPEEYYNDES